MARCQDNHFACVRGYFQPTVRTISFEGFSLACSCCRRLHSHSTRPSVARMHEDGQRLRGRGGGGAWEEFHNQQAVRDHVPNQYGFFLVWVDLEHPVNATTVSNWIVKQRLKILNQDHETYTGTMRTSLEEYGNSSKMDKWEPLYPSKKDILRPWEPL